MVVLSLFVFIVLTSALATTLLCEATPPPLPHSSFAVATALCSLFIYIFYLGTHFAFCFVSADVLFWFWLFSSLMGSPSLFARACMCVCLRPMPSRLFFFLISEALLRRHPGFFSKTSHPLPLVLSPFFCRCLFSDDHVSTAAACFCISLSSMFLT